MRIRKNAKISPLLYVTSSLLPETAIQTQVCQLNQSSWDAMNFSPPSAPPPPPFPPPIKVNKDDYPEMNRSSHDSIFVVESEKIDDDSDGDSAIDDKAEEEEGHIIFCCKIDGKSRRCKRKASAGHLMCAHHLTMMKNYTNNSAPKKQAAAVEFAAKSRPTRPKKASTSSNPYEFYYYSGFGPSWGKKRGQVNATNLEHEQGNESSTIDDQFVEADFEYSEDEDKDNKESGNKRPRKRIKARSLKSLM